MFQRTRILLIAGLLLCMRLHAEDFATPMSRDLSRDLLFYQGFDAGGVAYLQGGLAHLFPVAAEYLVDGKFGKGYRFEPPYANLLPPAVASPTVALTGFTAGTGVTLRVEAGRGMQQGASLRASGDPGVLWSSEPIDLTELPNPHRGSKSFLGSVYVRAPRAGTAVRLELLDDIEQTDWQRPINDANAKALQQNAKAQVTAPYATVTRAKEATLSPEWQRITAAVQVDTRRPTQRLRLVLTLLGTAAAEVEVSALQVEQYLSFPHDKDYASPWMPGGTRRAGNALSMPMRYLDFNAESGTIACWVQHAPPEGGGSRTGAFVTAGSGWWKPVWSLSLSGTCYAGDAGRDGYKQNQSYFTPQPAPFRDGAWHHVALTWEGDTCRLYQNGRAIGQANYLRANPADGAWLLLGATPHDQGHASAFLDEVTVWRRALSPAEITAMTGVTTPLAAGLPSLLIERPRRLVYHRGEATATLDCALVPLRESTRPVSATVRIPALGISQRVALSAKGAQLTLQPWKATPGRYPLTIISDDHALAVTANVEILPFLPSRDFTMLAWANGADLPAYGFTAELVDAHGLEPVLRRGMLACLRFDARDWHPLDPQRLSGSLDAAKASARKASPFPHVAMSLLNTEVGLQKPPSAPWFAEWMHAQIGMKEVPQAVTYGPLRINLPGESPPIIPQDDPTLRFTRWMRDKGKGWPDLNAQVAAAMRAEGLGNVRFYTDQPETTADVKGLNAVDYWAYPHVASGLVAEFNRVCTLAKLAGAQVSLMPGTVFWDPWPFRVDGKIACLSPDLLRQYLWITVANPLDHLGVYGLGELRKEFVPDGTADALRDTLAAIYPIGLLTGGLPQGPRRVAYLHTDGQLWQGPGDNQWIDFWFNRAATRALAEARVRYDWISDEHVEAGWLQRYKAVVMLGAWRVPEATHRALVAFARAGGTVVVDKCCRAEIPNAVVLDVANRGQQSAAVTALQAWGAAYRAQSPDPLRLRDGDAAWLYEKVDGPARFVFVVNDRMIPGTLGIDRKLQANLGTSTGPIRDTGEPQRVQLIFPPQARRTVYDVRTHAVQAEHDNRVELALAPGDAAVLAILPEPISRVEAKLPATIRAGSEVLLQVTIRTASGTPLAHRDLLEITGTDDRSTALDLPRFQRISRGTASIPIRVPLAASSGRWTLTLREWIAGQMQTVSVRIVPPAET